MIRHTILGAVLPMNELRLFFLFLQMKPREAMLILATATYFIGVAIAQVIFLYSN